LSESSWGAVQQVTAAPRNAQRLVALARREEAVEVGDDGVPLPAFQDYGIELAVVAQARARPFVVVRAGHVDGNPVELALYPVVHRGADDRLQRLLVASKGRNRDLLDDRDGHLELALHPHEASVEHEQVKALAGRKPRRRPAALLQLVVQALVRGTLLPDRAHGEVVEPAQRVAAVHVFDECREHDLVAAVDGQRGHEKMLCPCGQLARHLAQPHHEYADQRQRGASGRQLVRGENGLQRFEHGPSHEPAHDGPVAINAWDLDPADRKTASHGAPRGVAG